MKKIEELVKEYCPNGVEYKKIKEIAEVGTGNSNGNEASENGEYPFFIRSKTVKRKNTYEYDEEAIIIPGEGGIGEIYHYINGKYALHQRVYRIHFINSNINAKFAYYYFNAKFKDFIDKKAVSATVKSIRKPMIESFTIPIPPLPVQEEIVRILDTFTELTTELTAELTKRKKQYEYYRNEMLSFNINGASVAKSLLKRYCLDEVEYKKLKDIAVFCDGYAFKKSQLGENGIPIVRTTNLQDGKINIDGSLKCVMNDSNLDKYIIHDGDVLIGMSGSIKIARNNINKKMLLNQRVGAFRETKELNNNYLYHYLSLHINDLYDMCSGGTVKNLGKTSLLNFKIPVLPLPVQKKIARVLDNFDAICSDLKIGLPAEIEARQKQYEYYRNALLTFAETGDIIAQTDRQTDRVTDRTSLD